MVDLSEVEDKLPSGSFTTRAETDGIDIRQTVGLRQAQASGEARTAAMMRSEVGFFPADFLPQRQESSGNAYDENNSFVCCDIYERWQCGRIPHIHSIG